MSQDARGLMASPCRPCPSCRACRVHSHAARRPQIRTLLRLVDGRRYTCAQIKRITVEHLDQIHRKVADLRTIERVLKDMAAQCDGGAVPKCAVIDALFQRAPLGDGAANPHISR